MFNTVAPSLETVIYREASGACGLVLRIDGKKFKNRDVIVTTSLSLVIFTTIVFGSTVGLLERCLFK